jgi:hypothetical protein
MHIARFPFLKLVQIGVACVRLVKCWTLFEMYVKGWFFRCKKKRIAFIFVLPHPKKGE